MDISHMFLNRSVCTAAAALVFICVGSFSAEAASVQEELVQRVADTELPAGAIAVVNDEIITAEEFHDFYAVYVAQTYFHNVDNNRREEIANEAYELLISDTLLVQEANRRGLEGDPKKTAEQLAALEERYAGDDKTRELFAVKKAGIEEEILNATKIDALRENVMALGEVTDADIIGFYESRPELFTTPAAVDLAILLLPVPPHGLTEDWEAAQSQASELHARLMAGEPFAELAKTYSGHVSSVDGGGIGLVHAGQLASVVVTAIKDLSPGAYTAPFRILEGISIFKVNAREPAHLQAFSDIRERALALYEREESDRRWKEFLIELRGNARIKTAISPVSVLRDN